MSPPDANSPKNASRRFEQLRSLFEEACALDSGGRAELLARIRSEDGGLAGELQELLAQDEGGTKDDFLHPADAVADAIRIAADQAADSGGGSSSEHGPWSGPAGVDAGDAPPLDSLTAGDRLASFEIERRLAAGGMGTVYVARQDHPSRLVALKVLSEGTTSRRRLARFRLEAEVLARLDHPAIATIHAAGAVPQDGIERPWIAMEFIESARTLTAGSDEDGLDTPSRVARLREVAAAIRHAHQRGVIHRDLKPGNVLVSPDGRVKVIDFGVARADELVTRAGARTGAGELVGTLAYMSPEQCSGDPDAVDVRCDVYALGVLLWEMLAGRRPLDLDGLSLTAAVRRVAEEGVPRLDPDLPGVDPDLRSIVATATALDPSDRYQSTDALIRDLDAWMTGDAVSARPPGMIRRGRMLLRRHRHLRVGLAVGLVGLVAIVAVWTVLTARLADISNRRLVALERSDGMVEFLTGVLASGTKFQHGLPSRDLGDVLTVASGLVDEQFADDPVARTSLLRAIGSSFRTLDANEAALAAFDGALAAAIEADATNRDGTANVRLRVELLLLKAAVEVDRGQSAAATILYDRVDELLAEHPDIAADHAASIARNRLWVAITEGRARDIDAGILASSEHAAPPPDADVAETAEFRGLIGLALVELGRFEAAERELRSVLEITEDLPEIHPMRIRALNNVGWCLMHTSRTDEALEYLEAGKRAAIELFGEDHPTTFELQANIGSALIRDGRFAEAEQPTRKLLADKRRVLETDAAEIGDTEGDLWRILSNTRRHEEALGHAREGYRIRRAALGDDHPRTARAAQWIALSLNALGRRAESEAMLREALEIVRRATGPESRSAALAMNELAIAVFGREGYDEAAELFAAAATIYEAGSPGDDGLEPELAKALANRARCLLEAGRPGEALRPIERAWAMVDDGLAPANPVRVLARATLGETLAALGRGDEAIPHLEATVVDLEPLTGSAHPRMSRIRTTLSDLREAISPAATGG